MIIIWGTQVSPKVLGWVADFCPYCREIQRHRVIESRKVTHLYFIPLGQGEVIGYTSLCEACRNEVARRPEMYRGIGAYLKMPLEELVERTNPGAIDELERQIEMDERIASGTMTAEDRMQLLAQPFLAISGSVQRRASTLHVDPRTGVLIAMLVSVPLTLILSASHVRGSASGWLVNAGLAALVVIGLLLVHGLATDVSRFISRKLSSHLVESLMPLNPTREELQSILMDLKKQELAIGRKLTATRVMSFLAQARPMTETF